MTADATIHDPAVDQELLTALVERAARRDFARFEAQLQSSNNCARPVRLQGHVEVHEANGERRVWSTETEPDGVLRKACGNRREAVCAPCAERYRQDAYQLLLAGLCGGKGVPETVAEHPMVFATLTAPSFGPVHSLRTGTDARPRRCHPRRDAATCPHGVRMSCAQMHAEDDPCLGEPLCLDCYDHAGAVIWNNTLGELWRRTTIYLRRHLARHAGMTQKACTQLVVPAFAKVAEYHRRGLIHLHVLVRLDRAMPAYRRDEIRPPDHRFTVELLDAAVRSSVPAVRAKGSKYLGSPEVCWGDEIDIRPISDGRPAREAAGYLAKYATKSTEQASGLLHRVRPEEVERARVREHVRWHLRAAFELHAQAEPQADAARREHAVAAAADARRHPPTASCRYPNELAHRALTALAHRERVCVRTHDGARHVARIVACPAAEAVRGIECAVRLETGETIHLADVSSIAHPTPRFRDREDPRLAASAHQFGHRGHCLTKSHRYSTTFGALRRARHEHVLRQEQSDPATGQLALAEDRLPARITRLRYVGQGHFTTADALLAASAAARVRARRRTAWEELRAQPG